MKKYLFLLIATFGPLFSACDKAGDELQIERITGTWTWSTIEIDGRDEPVADYDMAITITFTSSGTWSGSGAGEGIEAFSGNGTYAITNTTIRLKENGLSGTFKWDILSLTETEAVFYWDEIGSKMTFVRR